MTFVNDTSVFERITDKISEFLGRPLNIFEKMNEKGISRIWWLPLMPVAAVYCLLVFPVVVLMLPLFMLSVADDLIHGRI